MRRFSTVPFKGTKEQEAELVAWLEEHKATPGVAMPALQKAQEIYGYLPIEVQRIVANTLGKPLAEIYGISTFYSQFSLCPKGEYKISVCLGTACYVKGSGKIYEKLQENCIFRAANARKTASSAWTHAAASARAAWPLS